MGLDRLSHTFTKDQEFCEALAEKLPEQFGRLFVYWQWALNYMPSIQDELLAMVAQHFAAAHRSDAGFWTGSLTTGIFRDLGLIPYLAARGLIWDSGFALRRSLESVGILAHLWHDPAKAEHLSDPDSGAFQRAFVNESDNAKAADMKQKGIRKRFALCRSAKLVTQLYRLLSEYSVHGGSPNLLAAFQVDPTRFSCSLLHRPDPSEKNTSRGLGLLGDGCEVVCLETAIVHATFGKKYGLLPSKGGEGGFFLTKLLERGQDSQMAHLVLKILQELGWAD